MTTLGERDRHGDVWKWRVPGLLDPWSCRLTFPSLLLWIQTKQETHGVKGVKEIQDDLTSKGTFTHGTSEIS